MTGGPTRSSGSTSDGAPPAGGGPGRDGGGPGSSGRRPASPGGGRASSGRGRALAEGGPAIPADWLAWISRLPAEGGPSGADWARRAQRLLGEAFERWGLVTDGPLRTGWTAVVAPVLRDGEPLALKLVRRSRDTDGEPLALRHWAGNGAVRLVAALPGDGMLLLERLDPDRDLRGLDTDSACEVIGGLLARLHVAAPPALDPLSNWAAGWLDEAGRRQALPRRMVARARGLLAELSTDPSCDATLVHGDLHYENVLAGTREPWLAIDPQPRAGHPGFELHAVLRNRRDELGTGAALRWSVRRRTEVLCEAAGIDEDIARRWTIVRCAIEAVWALEDDNADEVTFSIALAKALDD
ncbi:aminoglycoside phosphotransferase family protein [Fodinibacter luteus]|uniref:aminoglycoside phosphotransferase family protein n=1 Tax=Fodinibacter luteus TaxID=552064 RepID=UPI0031ED13AF